MAFGFLYLVLNINFSGMAFPAILEMFFVLLME